MTKNKTLKIVYSAVCLALAYTLPFLTGQIPAIGKALCPMHLPVLLCGFVCGWPWGLLVGFVAPILRSVLVGMPPLFPKGIAMAFELATYGALAGFLYSKSKKKVADIYISLLEAMLAGRIVWGIMRFVLAGFSTTAFPMSAFVAGAVTDAIPGIIAQIIIVPVLVLALNKAGLCPNSRSNK